MLNRGLNYSSRSLRAASQRVAAPNSLTRREFHIPASWNRWFNVPKGFEKYFRRGGSTKTESGGVGSAREKVDPKFNSTKSDKTRKTGGSGTEKKPDDENNMAKIIGGLGLLGLSTALLADDLKNGR
jgi:hypothetical protein